MLFRKGRTALQNEAFNYTRKLLQWRKGNLAVTKGNMKHFSIRQGVYVYQREYNGQSVVVFMNGTNSSQELELTPYREVLPSDSSTDLLSEKTIKLTDKLSLNPRETLILTF